MVTAEDDEDSDNESLYIDESQTANKGSTSQPQDAGNTSTSNELTNPEVQIDFLPLMRNVEILKNISYIRDVSKKGISKQTTAKIACRDFSKKPFGTNEMLNSALYHHLTTDNTMPPNSPNKQHTGTSNGLTGTQNLKNLLDAPSKQPTNPCAPLPTTIAANRPVRPQTETITQNDPSTQLNLNVNIQNDFRSQPNTNVYVQNDPTTQPNTNVYVQNDPTTQPNTNVYVQNDPRTHPYTNIYVQNGHQMDGNQMPKAQSSPNLPNKTSVIVTHPGNSAEGTMTYGQTNDQRPANNMPITINGYPVQNVSAPANQEAQIRQMYTKTSTEYYGQTTMTYQGGGPYRTCELTCPCRRGGVKSHSPLNPDRGAMSMHPLNEHQPMNSTFNHYFINRRALALNPGHKLMIPSSSHQHQSMNSTFNPHVTSQGVTALNPDHELWNPSLSPQLQTMNPTFNSQVTSRGALANPQHQPMNYLNSQPHLSSIHQHRMNFSMTSQTFTNPQPTTGMVGDPINRSPLTLQHQTMNPLNPQPHNARPPPCSSYAMGKPCVINPASSYLNVQPAVPMQNSQTGACKEYRQNYNRNVAMPRNPGYNSEQISKAAYLAALRSQEYLQNPTRDILGTSVPVNKNPRGPEKRRAKSVNTTKNIKATLAASQICTETMNNGASTSTLPFCTPTQSYPLPNWAAFGTQNDAPRKPTAKTTKAKVSNVKKTEDNNIEIPHIDLATDVTQKSNTNMTPKIMTAPFSIDTHKQTVNERIDTTQTNVTTTAHNMNAISLMQDSSNVEGQSKPMIMNVNNDGTPTYLMEAPTQQDRSSNDINQSQINTELPWIDMKSDGGYVQSETFLQQASDNIDIETAIALLHVDTDEAPGNAKQNSNALAKSTNAYELVSTSSVTTESTSHNIESNDLIMRTDTSNSVKTTKNIKATLAASQICTETMNNGASTSTLPFCTPTQSYPLPNWAAFGTQNDAPRKPTAKTIKSKVSNVKKTEDNNIEIPHIDLATDVTQKSNTNMTPKIMPAPFSIDTHKQTVNERIDTTQTNVTTTAHNMNAISLMQDSSNVEGQSKPMIMNVNNDGTPTYLMEAPTQHDRSSNDINQSQINTELPWIDMKSDGGYVQSETFLQQASDNIDIETAIALLHADTDEAPGNATQNSNALAKSTNAYELVSTSSVTTESTSHNIESNDIIMRTDTSNSVKTTKNIKATLAASQICTETMNNGASTSTLPFCTPTQSYPLPNWAAFGTQNDAPRKPTAKTIKAKVSNVKKTEDNNIEIPHIDLATDVTQKSYTNMTPKIMPAPFSIDTHKQTVNESIDTTQTNVTTTAHNMNAISLMQDSSNVEGQSKPMIMNVNNDGTPTYLMEAPTQQDRSSNDINQSQINTELPWIDMKSDGGYVQSETFLQQASDNIDIETAIALLHVDTDEAPGNAKQNSNALAKSTNAYELVSTSSVTTESTSHNIESNDLIMRTDTSNSVKTTKNIKATLAASQICTETMNNGASTSTLPFCTPTQSYPLPNWAAFGTQNDAPRKPTAKTTKAKVSNVKKTEDNNIEIPHIDLATDVTQKSYTNMTPKIMPAPFSIDTHKQTVNESIDTTQTNVTTTAHNMNAISLMQDSSNVEGQSKPMIMNVNNDGTPTYLMEAPTQHDRSSNDINQSQINTELPWIDMKSDGGYVQSETFLQQASDNIDIETAIALLHADTDEAPGNATQNSNALAKSTNAYELVSTSSVTTESTSHNIESNDLIMRTDTSNSVKTTKNIKATLAASQICTETMNNGASTSTLPFCTPTQSYPLPNWAAFGTQNDAPRKPTAKTTKAKVSNVKKTEDNNIEIPHIDLATDVTQKSYTNMTPKIMPAPFSIDTHKQTVNESIDTTQTNVTTTAHNMNAISLMQDSSNVEGQSKPMIMNVNNDGTPTYLMEAPTQHDRSSNDINQSQINTELPWIDMKSDGGYVQSETFLQQASDNIDIETAIALLHADTDEAPGNATQNSNALAKSTNAYELVSTSSVTTESTSHNIESNVIIMRTDTSNSVKTTKNIKATLAASQICTETMNNGASTSTLPFCTPTQSYPLPNWAAFGTQNDAPRKPTAKTIKAKVSNVKKTEDNNIEIPHIDLATDVTQKSNTNMTPKIMPAPFSIDTHKQTVNERIDTTQTNVTTTAHNMNAISLMQDSSNVEGKSKPMIMNVYNDGTPTYLMEAPTQHDRSSNDINQSQINTELPWIDMKSDGGYVQSETFLQQASDNIDIETAIALLHADTDEAPGNATQNSNALAKSTNAYELVSTSSVTTESTSHNIESNDIIMRTDTSNSKVHNNQKVNIKQIIENTVTVSRVKKIITNPNISLPKTETLLDILNKVHSTKEANTGENMEPTRTEDENKIKTTDAAVDDGSTKGIEEDDHQTKDVPDSKDDDILETARQNLARWSAIEHDNKNKRADYNTNTDTDVNVNVKISSSDSSSVQQEKFNMNCSIDKTTQLKSADSSEYNILPKLETKIENQLDINYAGESQEFKNIKNEEPESAKEELIIFKFQIKIFGLLSENNQEVYAQKLHNAIHDLITLSDYKDATADLKYEFHECHNVTIFSPRQFYQNGINYVKSLINSVYNCQFCPTFRRKYIEFLIKHIKLRTSGANLNTFSKQIGENTEINAQKLDTTTDLIIERQTNSKPALLNYESDSTNKSNKVCIVKEQRGLITADAPSSSKQVEIKDQKKHNNKNTPDSQNQTNFVVKLPLHMLKKSTVESLIQCKSSKSNDNKSDGVTATVHGNRNISTSLANNNNNKKHLSKRKTINAENAPSSNPDPRNINSNPSSNNNDSKIESHSEKEKSINETNPVLQKINATFVSKNMADSDKNHTRQPKKRKSLSAKTAPTTIPGTNTASDNIDDQNKIQDQHSKRKKSTCNITATITSRGAQNSKTSSVNNDDNDRNHERSSKKRKSPSGEVAPSKNTNVSKNNDKDHEGHSKRRKSISAESETRANQNDCHNNYKNKEKDRETTKNICGQLTTPEDIDTATKNNEEHETRQPNASKNISDETATSKNDESQKRKTITTSNNDSSNSSKEPCNPQINHANNKKDNNEVRKSIDSETTTNKNTERLNVQDNASNKNNNNDKNIARTSEATKSTKKQTTTGRNTTSTETTTNNNTEKQQSITLKIFRDHVSKNNDKDHEGHSKRRKSINAESETRANQNDCHNNYKNKERDRETTKNICGQLITPEDIDTATKNNEEHETRQPNASKNISGKTATSKNDESQKRKTITTSNNDSSNSSKEPCRKIFRDHVESITRKNNDGETRHNSINTDDEKAFHKSAKKLNAKEKDELPEVKIPGKKEHKGKNEKKVKNTTYIAKITDKYICSHCYVRYSSFPAFEKHSADNHKIVKIEPKDYTKMITCPFCPEDMIEKVFNKHVKDRHPDKHSQTINK